MSTETKRHFKIYGLRVIGEGKFFYIGCTINMKSRIGCHIGSALSGTDDSAKSKVINNCECKIEMVELDSITTVSRTEANNLENEWIEFLRGEGHPLTNSVRVVIEKPYRIVPKKTVRGFSQ